MIGLLTSVAQSVAILAAGLGMMAAGIAIARFFARAEKVIEYIPGAMDRQSKAQEEMVLAHNREAAAVEKSANLVPILEQLQAEREDVGRTLRVMSRELRELRGLLTHEETNDSGS